MTRHLGERYELQTVIGGGGMAIVYKALDTMLDRTVAVKMLRPQYAGDEEFVGRFRQEAQAAARLSHPNIVNLYDVGMADGEYYIVMEYVDGPTLKDVIRERGPLPVPEALGISKQMCEALAHAHDHRIIHRDIKPHNILLTQSGQVKVTDFGIARAVTGNTITQHYNTSVLGSVHYFSPEQARGGSTDVKSDIYSLGVVIYEMVTKLLPFSGDSPVSVALKHLRDHFVEPRQINLAIPQSVENIILRCLVKAPEGRYPDMRSVKADLDVALVHPDVAKFIMPDEVTDETIAVPAIGGKPPTTTAVVARPPELPPRKWWRGLLWTSVGVAVLFVGAVAAYYIVMDLLQVPSLELPNVVNQPYAAARGTLLNAGIPATQIIEHQAHSSKPTGIVYEQNPQGSTEIKQNRSVVLYVSSGPAQVQVPALANVPIDQAEVQLKNDGFTKFSEQLVQSASVPVGDVVQTTPASGQTVSPDTPIVLQVSQGAQTTVPAVFGMTLQAAETALKSANLQVGQVSPVQVNAPDGTVVSVMPYQPGTKVPAGTIINLYVQESSPNGNTTANSTSGGLGGGADGNNTVGAPPPNLPPNTHERVVEVRVNDRSGQQIQVQIVKTDSSATNDTVVDQTIATTTSWTVTLYIAPNSQGQLQVYENGQLKQNYPVSY